MSVTIFKDPIDGTRLVKPADAGRLVYRSRRTIYNWIERGVVRTRQFAGGGLLVEVDSLMKVNEPIDMNRLPTHASAQQETV